MRAYGALDKYTPSTSSGDLLTVTYNTKHFPSCGEESQAVVHQETLPKHIGKSYSPTWNPKVDNISLPTVLIGIVVVSTVEEIGPYPLPTLCPHHCYSCPLFLHRQLAALTATIPLAEVEQNGTQQRNASCPLRTKRMSRMSTCSIVYVCQSSKSICNQMADVGGKARTSGMCGCLSCPCSTGSRNKVGSTQPRTLLHHDHFIAVHCQRYSLADSVYMQA